MPLSAHRNQDRLRSHVVLYPVEIEDLIVEESVNLRDPGFIRGAQR
jgi:hypothetical protein